MFLGAGIGEIVVLVGVLLSLAGVLILVPAWLIIRKAGFNPLWAFVMLLPLVNFAALYVFALSRWPVQRDARVR